MTEGHCLHQSGGLGFDTQGRVALKGGGRDGHEEGVHGAELKGLGIGSFPLHRIEGVVGSHLVRVAEQRIRVVNVRHLTGTQTCGQLHSEVAQGKLTIHLNAERQRGQRSVDVEGVVRELITRIGSHIGRAVRGLLDRLC